MRSRLSSTSHEPGRRGWNGLPEFQALEKALNMWSLWMTLWIGWRLANFWIPIYITCVYLYVYLYVYIYIYSMCISICISTVYVYLYVYLRLVVSTPLTPLKNIRQLELFFPIYGKSKKPCSKPPTRSICISYPMFLCLFSMCALFHNNGTCWANRLSKWWDLGLKPRFWSLLLHWGCSPTLGMFTQPKWHATLVYDLFGFH